MIEYLKSLGFGHYEPACVKIAEWILSDDSGNAVDIGASEGYFSFIFSKLLPNGNVFAFEALETAYKKLEEKVKQLDITNIHVFNYVVGNGDKGILVEYNKAGDTRFIPQIKPMLNLPENPFEFEANIQSYKLQDLSLPADIRLIKIDTQGSEVDIIEGSSDFFNSTRASLIVECCESLLKRRGASAKKLADLLANCGYNLQRFDPTNGNIIPRWETNKPEDFEQADCYLYAWKS